MLYFATLKPGVLSETRENRIRNVTERAENPVFVGDETITMKFMMTFREVYGPLFSFKSLQAALSGISAFGSHTRSSTKSFALRLLKSQTLLVRCSAIEGRQRQRRVRMPAERWQREFRRSGLVPALLSGTIHRLIHALVNLTDVSRSAWITSPI